MSTPADHDTDHTAAAGDTTSEEGTPLQYATVEDWVRDYIGRYRAEKERPASD